MNIKRIIEFAEKIEEYNGDAEKILASFVAKTITSNKLPWKVSCITCENQTNCKTFKKITELIQIENCYTDYEYTTAASLCDSFSIINDTIFINTKNLDALFPEIEEEKLEKARSELANGKCNISK